MQNHPEIKIVGTEATKVPEHRPESSKTLSKTTIFRSKMSKARAGGSNMKPDHSLDKELLQGIQKLGSSLNHVTRKAHRHSSNMKIGEKPSTLFVNSNMDLIPTVTPSIENEKPPLTDFIDEPPRNLLLCDKGTMTDLTNARKLDLQNSVLNKDVFRDLQWTDPRLIKKYGITQSYKKSLTIPLVDKGDMTELLTETSDDGDGDTESMINFSKKSILATASVSVIGATCGILLIAMMIWKVMDEDFLQLLGIHLKPKSSDEFLVKIYFKYFTSAVVNFVNTTFKTVAHILTVPTSEVFGKQEEDHSWTASFLTNYF